MVVADAGYKTPAIAHQLSEDGIQPLFPYTRPKTKEGFFGKHEFAYDEYYDCYICPEAHILTYSTTNRNGYKEYKSCGEHCAECQYFSKCTESKDHVKLITRHVWEEYMEVAEDIRHTIGNRQIYQLRKETIERIFGTAKEQHGFRYTQYVGKARMEMKAGLTFACMNLKKLAKILEKRDWNTARFLLILKKIKRKEVLKEKENAKIIIVVPTSLIYNWQKEFEKFAPNLKYVVVADNKQKRKEIFEKKDDYNIFITSYGLIRNDKDEYENVDFELCIVDEAQNIKNYQAEMTKEIKKIKAKCKIALTGTPLENNVTELWSIFDFIMPGYLNSVIKFREKYNVKDVDEEGLKLLENLNHQIKPFILRRKKQDVVKSLPKKIENKIYIL